MVIKPEKNSQIFRPRLSENFYLVFTSLKMPGSFKNYQFFVKKIKTPDKYCTDLIETTCSNTLVLVAKIKNSAF